MSEKRSRERPSPDEYACLLAMARVMAGDLEAPLPAAADAERVREYTELLGLLPWELEAAAPSPEVKARLLARLDGHRPASERTAAAAFYPERGFDEVTLANTSASDPIDMTMRRRAANSERPAAAPVPSPPLPAAVPDRAGLPANVVPMPPRVTSWWTPALAAMLALCMVGLAFLAGKIRQQNTLIADLDSQVRQVRELPVDHLSSLETELATLKRRFHMVTAIARHEYPMKTVRTPPGSQIDGRVYVCGKHQRWYLSVQGLEAPPAGKEYNLWFVTDQGMLHGGNVRVGADASTEMDDQSLPQGTHGFAITLEESGAPLDEPNGTMVLLAEESMST